MPSRMSGRDWKTRPSLWESSLAAISNGDETKEDGLFGEMELT